MKGSSLTKWHCVIGSNVANPKSAIARGYGSLGFPHGRGNTRRVDGWIGRLTTVRSMCLASLTTLLFSSKRTTWKVITFWALRGSRKNKGVVCISLYDSADQLSWEAVGIPIVRGGKLTTKNLLPEFSLRELGTEKAHLLPASDSHWFFVEMITTLSFNAKPKKTTPAKP